MNLNFISWKKTDAVFSALCHGEYVQESLLNYKKRVLAYGQFTCKCVSVCLKKQHRSRPHWCVQTILTHIYLLQYYPSLGYFVSQITVDYSASFHSPILFLFYLRNKKIYKMHSFSNIRIYHMHLKNPDWLPFFLSPIIFLFL